MQSLLTRVLISELPVPVRAHQVFFFVLIRRGKQSQKANKDLTLRLAAKEAQLRASGSLGQDTSQNPDSEHLLLGVKVKPCSPSSRNRDFGPAACPVPTVSCGWWSPGGQEFRVLGDAPGEGAVGWRATFPIVSLKKCPLEESFHFT